MDTIEKPQPENRLLQETINLIRYTCRRVNDEQLTQVAGNMTYTLILGVVPALAVALAVFTRLPEFDVLRDMIEIYFMRGIIPSGIAETLLGYLSTFAEKAARVSIIGSLAMLFTTVMLFNLIETTFNRIWGVQEPRSFLRRIIVYICIATFGPILLGGSLYLTSYLYLAARGVVGGIPYMNGIWPIIFLCGVSTLAFACLYRFVPFRPVLWKDALTGGLFSAVAFEIAKRLFAIFVMQFASYQKIYGALAIIPIFLLWLYVSSLIILSGAVLTSALPDFRTGRWRHVVKPGEQFSSALQVIRVLYCADMHKNTALDWNRLQRLASLSSAELENMLLKMEELKWIVHLQHHAKWLLNKRKKRIQRALDEWKWTGDANRVTLADVYTEFVFKPEEEDTLSLKVKDIIENNLNQTLADYFAELEENDSGKAAPAFS